MGIVGGCSWVVTWQASLAALGDGDVVALAVSLGAGGIDKLALAWPKSGHSSGGLTAAVAAARKGGGGG